MNIKELVERLAEIAEAYPNAEVMLATQPGYPIAETLRGVADPDDEWEADDADAPDPDDAPPAVVWLVSGGQSHRYDVSPYAPSWVFGVAA